jgi:hypothetical protein
MVIGGLSLAEIECQSKSNEDLGQLSNVITRESLCRLNPDQYVRCQSCMTYNLDRLSNVIENIETASFMESVK